MVCLNCGCNKAVCCARCLHDKAEEIERLESVVEKLAEYSADAHNRCYEAESSGQTPALTITVRALIAWAEQEVKNDQ